MPSPRCTVNYTLLFFCATLSPCLYTSMPLRIYASTPLRLYASTPLRLYTSTPLHQYAYASMPLLVETSLLLNLMVLPF